MSFMICVEYRNSYGCKNFARFNLKIIFSNMYVKILVTVIWVLKNLLEKGILLLIKKNEENVVLELARKVKYEIIFNI